MIEKKPLPPATIALIAINIGAAFLVALRPVNEITGLSPLIQSLGFWPNEPKMWAAITSQFLHLNLIHLLSNMVFLAAVAPAVEVAAGSLRLLAIYLFGGISGVLLHWIVLMNQPSAPVLIGASGSIAACVAYYSIRFFRVKVPLAPKLSVPVWSMALIWVILQAIGGMTGLNSEGGAAYWAHLGGFGFGLVTSAFARAGSAAFAEHSQSVLDEMNQRSPAAALAAAENHLKHHPNDASAWLTLGEAQHRLGDDHHAIESFLKSADLGDVRLQFSSLSNLADLNSLNRVHPIKRARFAAEFKGDYPDLTRKLLRSIAEEPDSEPQKPDALYALAEIEMASESNAGNALVGELLERFPFHPAAERARAKGWTP